MSDVQITTVEFARAARHLALEARRLGLVPPAFRAPPRQIGVDRTLRWAHRRPIVSVRLVGRDPNSVFSDMVDGCMIANDTTDPETRLALWQVVR